MLIRRFGLRLGALASTVVADAEVDGKLSFYTSVWHGWGEHVARWSMYEPPTFSMVFKPETEDELSQGVSIPFVSIRNVLNISTDDIFV